MPRSRTKTTPDAIDMLKQDHDKVEKAFREFDKMDRQDAQACRRLIEGVCEDLKVHATLEEEMFYPAVREAIEDEDPMNEAAVEHAEYVRHHVKEEQGEIFPAAKKAELDLAALGGRMRARREELCGAMERSAA